MLTEAILFGKFGSMGGIQSQGNAVVFPVSEGHQGGRRPPDKPLRTPENRGYTEA